MSSVSSKYGHVVVLVTLLSGTVVLMYSNIMMQCYRGSISGHCDWRHIGDDMIASSSSVTVFGSILTLNAWNHLVISTCKELQHKSDSKNFSFLMSGDIGLGSMWSRGNTPSFCHSHKCVLISPTPTPVFLNSFLHLWTCIIYLNSHITMVTTLL